MQGTLLRYGEPLILADDTKLSTGNGPDFKSSSPAPPGRNHLNQPELRNTNIFTACNSQRASFLPPKSSHSNGITLNYGTHHAPPLAVLANIQPPRRYRRFGKTYEQEVSDSSSSRAEVLDLKRKMENHIREVSKEEIDLCRKRREVITQCFDEIIREVTLTCVDRGQLLLGIRNEINAAFKAYESLFFGAVSCGIRRRLTVEHKISEWNRRIHEIKEQIQDVSDKQEEFAPTSAAFQAKLSRQLEAHDTEYEAEYERLIKNNGILKNLLLKCVLTTPKELKDEIPV